MRKNKQGAAVPIPAHKKLGKQIMKHWELYLLLLPGILLTIIFKYIPIYGVQIAFRERSSRKAIIFISNRKRTGWYIVPGCGCRKTEERHSRMTWKWKAL